MEDDVRTGSNPEMTADRDRVEAAWRAYQAAEGCMPGLSHIFHAGWKAAADALAPPPTGRRVRHVKRGTTYTVLGEAVAQVDAQGGIDTTKLDWRRSRLIHEDDKLVVYQDDVGALYARPSDEFEDGRFEPIADAPAPAAPPPTGRWRVGRRVPVNVYRDDVVAAQFQRPEWAAEAVSALNRVRELEEALREADQHVTHLTRGSSLLSADEARAWRDRARAIIGGGHAD